MKVGEAEARRAGTPPRAEAAAEAPRGAAAVETSTAIETDRRHTHGYEEEALGNH